MVAQRALGVHGGVGVRDALLVADPDPVVGRLGRARRGGLPAEVVVPAAERARGAEAEDVVAVVGRAAEEPGQRSAPRQLVDRPRERRIEHVREALAAPQVRRDRLVDAEHEVFHAVALLRVVGGVGQRDEGHALAVAAPAVVGVDGHRVVGGVLAERVEAPLPEVLHGLGHERPPVAPRLVRGIARILGMQRAHERFAAVGDVDAVAGLEPEGVAVRGRQEEPPTALDDAERVPPADEGVSLRASVTIEVHRSWASRCAFASAAESWTRPPAISACTCRSTSGHW